MHPLDVVSAACCCLHWLGEEVVGGLLIISAWVRAGQDRPEVDGEQTSMQICAYSPFVELAVHVTLLEAAGSPSPDLDGLYASDDRDQTQSACLPGPEVLRS